MPAKTKTEYPPFWERVASEMDRLGWTQEQLGDYLGISRGSAAQLMTPRGSNPSLSRVIELVSIGMDARTLVPELFASD